MIDEPVNVLYSRQIRERDGRQWRQSTNANGTFRRQQPAPQNAPLDRQLRRLRRFFRSPQGYLVVALLLFTVLGAPSTGITDAASIVAAAVVSATILDLLWMRLQQRVWRAPTSALLTGMIIGLVLSAQEPWYVAAAAGALAIAAKHVLRLGRSPMFNPAAVGLLAVYFLFGSGQSWWGALPGWPLPALAIVAAGGMIVAGRANKIPAALAFLATYMALFTLTALAGQSSYVSDIFRSPFVNMAVFFAFIMVDDPPTSPIPFSGQIWFGAGVAVISFATYMATHGLYYLLVGLLVANAVYAVAYALLHARRRDAALGAVGPILDGFDNPFISGGLAVAAIGLVLLLVGGIVAFQQSDVGSTNSPQITSAAPANSQQGASAAPAPQPAAGGSASAPGGGPAAPAALSFQDHFTGTVNQQTDQTGGGTVNITISGTGERPVQLAIKLAITSVGRGRSRVTGNQATLSDAGGTQICQGQVTALDDTGFMVRCQAGNGSSAGSDLAVVGTINGSTATQMQGDLQVAPFGG